MQRSELCVCKTIVWCDLQGAGYQVCCCYDLHLWQAFGIFLTRGVSYPFAGSFVLGINYIIESDFIFSLLEPIKNLFSIGLSSHFIQSFPTCSNWSYLVPANLLDTPHDTTLLHPHILTIVGLEEGDVGFLGRNLFLRPCL